MNLAEIYRFNSYHHQMVQYIMLWTTITSKYLFGTHPNPQSMDFEDGGTFPILLVTCSIRRLVQKAQGRCERHQAGAKGHPVPHVGTRI